jgi:hypothetical protein
MKRDTKESVRAVGIGLIGLGFLPTPDDVSVISPLVQIAIGSALLLTTIILPTTK